MEYYCMMVKTRGEEKFKRRLEKLFAHASYDADVILFKKKLRTRKNEEYEKPLLPGYLFIACKDKLDLGLIWMIKRTEDFYRFMNSNRDIKPLYGRDLEFVQRLLTFGKTQGLSKAYFNENMRIVVVDGPLKGFSGNIYKVNRRQQRVTVLLEMFQSNIKFDLGYELIAMAPGQGQAKTGQEHTE